MLEQKFALEDELTRILPTDPLQVILCRRGSLVSLGYWLARGWPEDESYTLIQTCLEDHYHCYATVIHLVTAADWAAWAYRRWLEAHRSESQAAAIQIDRLLEKVWREHPRYYQIDKEGRDWPAKWLATRQVF